MIEVYSWATPNGHMVHIMLEECGLIYHALPEDILIRLGPKTGCPRPTQGTSAICGVRAC